MDYFLQFSKFDLHNVQRNFSYIGVLHNRCIAKSRYMLGQGVFLQF